MVIMMEQFFIELYQILLYKVVIQLEQVKEVNQQMVDSLP
jgi:hypothetical protein